MKRNLLVTRPNYDDATSYLFYYARQVIDFARGKGTKVLDLVRPRLSKQNFSDIISRQDPVLVFFNAHGDEKRIYGDKKDEDEEILIEEGENHTLLSKRIVYARACYAAASLGEVCTRKGGCFIGYKTPFSFWIDERWSAKPSNDKTAVGFFLSRPI